MHAQRGPHDDRASPSPAAASGGERLWRAIVESTRERLLVLDEELRVVDANPAFLKDADESIADQRGRSVFEISQRQWDVPPFREMLATVVAQGTAVEGVEITRDSPGSRRIFSINARPIELDHQQLRLVLVAFEEVTEQRLAERKAELYARQLERSNRELEDFAHAASHDLQEPLRKVRTFASRLIATFDAAQLDERQRDYAARMEDAANRMQVRIDDLLTLARVSRQWPQREPTDLQAVIARVLSDLSERAPDVDIVVEADDVPPIEASGAHMELLFQNLISNAIKFRRTEAGSRIVIRAVALARDPTAERDRVRISVEDNGIGFEPEFAERIFRPFERLHGRNEYPGSGVGLSIVRRIAELYGGTASAEGRPGAGATFTVDLPLTQPMEVP